MRSLNHECIICGTKYYACNACEKTRSWRVVADTIECYQTYLAWIQYRDGFMAGEDFTEVLIENEFEGKKVAPELQEIFDSLLAPKEPEEKVVEVKSTKTLK